MADVKISALPASTLALAGTEVLPIVQSSTTKQVSVANLTIGRAVDTLNLSTSGSTSTTPVLGFNASNCNIASGATVASTYLQAVMQNKSGTAGASTNYVLSNDLGTDSTYYGEFGMNSSVFSASTPVDFFSINNGVYFSAHDGDVSVGSGNGFKTYLAWGTTGQSAHVINATGALGLSTNLGTTPALSGTTGYGTAKNVLVSQGSGAAPVWSTSTDILVNGVTLGKGGGAIASNTALGVSALAATATGGNNVAVGQNALSANLGGSGNIGIGYSAGQNITSASNCVAIGQQALQGMVTQGGCVAVGYQSLGSCYQAGNTALGNNSLGSVNSGSGNTAVGQQAGVGNSSANATTSGGGNIFIGYQTVGTAATNTNETVIGYTAVGNGSNTTTIGNSSTTNTVIPAGNVTLTNGNVVQGTAAKGVNFTANTPAAGMTSQLLNWYEEGTFTPVYSQISGGAITYTTQTGSYVRIGRQVTAYFLITVNTNTHTVGNAAVTLPFTAGFTGRLGYVAFNNTATALLATFNVVSGNAFAYPNTTGGAALSAASITNGSILSGTIIYFV